jgi:hypothetical protein
MPVSRTAVTVHTRRYDAACYDTTDFACGVDANDRDDLL